MTVPVASAKLEIPLFINILSRIKFIASYNSSNRRHQVIDKTLNMDRKHTILPKTIKTNKNNDRQYCVHAISIARKLFIFSHLLTIWQNNDQILLNHIKTSKRLILELTYKPKPHRFRERCEHEAIYNNARQQQQKYQQIVCLKTQSNMAIFFYCGLVHLHMLLWCIQWFPKLPNARIVIKSKKLYHTQAITHLRTSHWYSHCSCPISACRQEPR